MRREIRISGILFRLMLFLPPGWAQMDTGTIGGTVSDATGAVIPGASVKVTNTLTGISFETTTNDVGRYIAPALRVGPYAVNVEARGFKKAVVTGLTLQVNQTMVADVTMEVGQVSQVTEVTATPPLLQEQSVVLGDVITEKQVKDLPLNGRNFVQLLTLTPGVTPGASSSPQTQPILTSARGTTAVQINGQNDLSTNYLLDGIDNNETTIGGIIIFPPVDAIQEFKVQTAASSSDFGRNGGGQVNVTLKSGANELHGNAFEFLRNSALDAKNFFDPVNQPAPPLRLNQFGFTLGGPIRKDRTFFFMDYQGSRVRQGQTLNLTVPTVAMRNGDFSELNRPIYDPASYDATTNTRQVFPNAIIPRDRFSRPAVELTALQYPMPQRPTLSANYTFTPNRPSTTDSADGKIDHQFSRSNNFFARYSFSNFDVGETFFAATVLPSSLLGNKTALDTDPTHYLNQSLAASDTHMFKPTLINEFRFGYTRFNEFSPNRLNGYKAAELVGIHGINNPNIAYTDGLPQIGISGFSGIGEVSFLPFISVINTFQYIDNLIQVKGSHTLKYGLDVRRRQFNFYQPPAQRGNFSFTGVFTNNPAAPANSGSGYADFLLGVPQSSSQEVKVNANTGQRSTEWSFYVADTWRLTPRLTMDMGLRYELTTPRTEVADRQSNFDPSVPGGAFRVASPSAPCGRALRCTDRTGFAPRLGLAYKLNNKTVVRSAYGIFYDVTGFNGYQGTIFSLFQNPPFTVGQNIINSATNPRNRFEDGFPPVPVVPVVDGLVRPDAVPGYTFSGRLQEYNLRMTYVQNWHFTLEHEPTANLLLGASYVGSKGTRVLQNLGINDPRPGPGDVAPRRPFPGFANINDQSASGSSIYHSLQARVQKRYSQGLTFLGAYTWAKVLADVNGLGGSRAQDFYNRRAERGRTSFDIAHRFVASFNYELPIGAGKPVLGDAKGALQKILGEWQAGGILTLQTGEPFTVGLATPVSNTASANRPNRVCSGKLDHPTIDRWFDTSCFVTPTIYTFGNSGVGILEGPGTKQLDWSVLKRIPVDEKRYFQFRGEFFNLFNTPQFNNPGTAIGSTSAAIISSAGQKVNFLRTQRQIQFALKFFW
jgi:hypothetical protein